MSATVGRECRSLCRVLASRWRLFCEGSSIRGVQKILKARSPFIRVLWVSFVVVMTLVLVIVSGFLVNDFLNYDTAWHTSTAFDVKPEFPSFTLCSHSPFSYEAENLWNSGEVLSPLSFQQRLRNITGVALENALLFLHQMYAYDSVDTYYQQLTYNESVQIGHNRSSLFFCVVVVGGSQYIADNCEMPDIEVSVRLYSYGEFFNCFTVDADNVNYSREFESIIVIISLVPMEKLPQLGHSFLYDVLTRGEGVKVAIHEKGTIPDFGQSGFNVEPGRMNEISYGTTGWRKLATPKHACRDHQPPVAHLGREYTGNYHQCVNAQLQRYLMTRCGCQSTLWPVLKVPDASTPYCVDVSGDIASVDYVARVNSRFECASDVLQNMEALKRNLSVRCLPRCTYSTFETALSIAKWVPSASKLTALVDHYKWGSLHRDAKVSNAEFLAGVGRNISSNASNEYSKHLSQQNAYTYIKIRRRNWDMTLKEEKLTLDVNVLLSRIGGLCSLCIGLTAAFVVEIFEFFYLSTQGAGPDSADNVRGSGGDGGDIGGGDACAAPPLSAAASERLNLLDPWEKSECAAFRPPAGILAAFADADSVSDVTGSPAFSARSVFRRAGNNHAASAV